MRNLLQFLFGKTLIAIFVAVAACVPTSSRAGAQSLDVCENWAVDSTNNVQETLCIMEYTSNGTWSSNGTWIPSGMPVILASTEVFTPNAAYVPAVDSQTSLADANTFIGEFDYMEWGQNQDTTDDAWAGVSAPVSPNDYYILAGTFGECYDPTGNYGIDPSGGGDLDCEWNYPNITELLNTSLINPEYQIATLLYSPPGNQSTSGFGGGTTNGTTTTVGSSFTQAENITFSGGIQGENGGLSWSVGATFGYSNTTSNSNTFTEQITDATSIATDDNSNSAYNVTGLNGTTLSDAISHHLDTFQLLLNPQLTTGQTHHSIYMQSGVGNFL